MILKNAVVYGDSFNPAALDVAVRGERISEIGPALPAGDEPVLDCEGCVVVPGFVDIHIHACVGADTCDANPTGLAKMCAHLAGKGVTSFCPTTMTVSHGEIERALAAVREAMTHPPEGTAIAGVNMEGPYISAHRKGAQSEQFVKAPDFSEFREFFEGCGGIIRIVDVAPECAGAEEFIPQAVKLCTVSIAHTEADYACATRAFDLGVTHATHLYNAMPGLSHRAPGVVGAVFDDARVRAELICDGFHIDPAVLRVTFTLLGEDRTVIVSDSMRAAGEPDGVSELGGQTVYVKNGQARLKDGTIAGSTTDMHQEVRNLVKWGVPFRQVIKSATINPAKEIHMEDRIGSIRVGKFADLVVLDPELNLRYVIARGKIVKDSRK